MQENPTYPSHPVLFFVSKFLILAGMVLVFTFVGAGMGAYLSKLIWGIDVFSNPAIINDLENPLVVNMLKLTQVCYAIGAFMVPAWYFPRALQKPSADFLKANRGFTFTGLLVCIALLLISTPFASWLVYINENVKFPASLAGLEQQLQASEASAQKITEVLTKTTSFNGLLANLFIVAILPAICEEFLFRGALLNFLSTCFHHKQAAIFVSAFIFSLIHWQFYGFIPRFVLGVFLGYMVMGTGSIWPAVIVHFINNAIATLAVYYNWNESSTEILRSDYVFPVYVNVISFVLSLGLLYLLYKKWHQKIYPNGE